MLAKEQKHYATSGEVLYESHRGARGRMPWLTNMMATSGSPFQHAITYNHIQQLDIHEFEQQDTNKLVAKGDRRILKPRVIANRYLNRALLSRAGQTQKVSASERCFGGTPLGFQLQVPSFPVLGFRLLGSSRIQESGHKGRPGRAGRPGRLLVCQLQPPKPFFFFTTMRLVVVESHWFVCAYLQCSFGPCASRMQVALEYATPSLYKLEQFVAACVLQRTTPALLLGPLRKTHICAGSLRDL